MILSCGLLLWRRVAPCSNASGAGVSVLLGHMGGPFFNQKHEGGWSIPKGLTEPGEDAIAAAEREFAEEMGSAAPPGVTVDLGSLAASGKHIQIFAREGFFDAATAVSNTFTLEWPPRSGQWQDFPEIDRAAWVDLDDAEVWLAKSQRPFVGRLRAALS